MLAPIAPALASAIGEAGGDALDDAVRAVGARVTVLGDGRKPVGTDRSGPPEARRVAGLMRATLEDAERLFGWHGIDDAGAGVYVSPVEERDAARFMPPILDEDPPTIYLGFPKDRSGLGESASVRMHELMHYRMWIKGLRPGTEEAFGPVDEGLGDAAGGLAARDWDIGAVPGHRALRDLDIGYEGRHRMARTVTQAEKVSDRFHVWFTKFPDPKYPQSGVVSLTYRRIQRRFAGEFGLDTSWTDAARLLGANLREFEKAGKAPHDLREWGETAAAAAQAAFQSEPAKRAIALEEIARAMR